MNYLLFNNFFYLAFLALVMLSYFLTPKKWRWITLLIASAIFYASFSYKWLCFIISSIVTIYLSTRYFDKLNNSQSHLLENYGTQLDAESKKKYKKTIKQRKKVVLVLAILFNIGILFLLKYLNFMGGVINDIAGWFSAGEVVNERIKLPFVLGLSFYTFQAVGYLVDCYWGKIKPEKNIFKFALFLSFFPQIVQGPISRYSELGQQLTEGHDFDFKRIIKGLQLIVWGLFKKMVIADLLAGFIGNVFTSYDTANNLIVLIGVICYLIQDYTDFSGCIDIARGSAECLGINLPQNFERPYFSLSISDYWRRWHMSLGSWFKDYIFYPISISKMSLKISKSKAIKKVFGKFSKTIPAIIGLFVTWLATGIWHGASWNYIVWGLYFGFLVILQIIFKPFCDKIIKKLKINSNNIFWKIFSWFRTIILLIIGRIIFRAPSLSASWHVFLKTFNFAGWDFFEIIKEFTDFGFNASCIVALICTLIVLAVDLYKEFKPNISIRDSITTRGIWLSWPIYIGLIIIIVIFGSYGISYNTADFIYMQF